MINKPFQNIYFVIVIDIFLGSASIAATCIDLKKPTGTAHPEQQPLSSLLIALKSSPSKPSFISLYAS
jgi:hypothetical protein